MFNRRRRSSGRFGCAAAMLMMAATSARADINLSGLYTRIGSFSVSVAQSAETTVSCDVGDYVINAGHQVDRDSLYTHAVSSFPASRPDDLGSPGSQWTVQIYNGGTKTVNATVTIICAPAAAFGPFGVVAIKTTAKVPEYGGNDVRLTCPVATKSIGGGWEQPRSGPSTWVTQSFPDTSTSWTVRFLDADTSSEQVSAWAICAPATAPISVKRDTFHIGTFDAGAREGSVTCDAGDKTLGGFFELYSKQFSFHILRSYPSNASTWTVRAVKDTPFISTDVDMGALCYPRSGIGTAEIAPYLQAIPVDAPVGYTLHYSLPDQLQWRDLASLDFRLTPADGFASPQFIVRFDPRANAFQLFNEANGSFDSPLPIGSVGPLSTAGMTLDLSRSMWWDQGQETGQEVGMRLVFRFDPALVGHQFQADVIVTAADGRSEINAVGMLDLRPAGSDPTSAALGQVEHLMEKMAELQPGDRMPQHVQHLQKAIEREHFDTACGQLSAFRREVSSGSGLTAAQVMHLLADSNTLGDLLACK